MQKRPVGCDVVVAAWQLIVSHRTKAFVMVAVGNSLCFYDGWTSGKAGGCRVEPATLVGWPARTRG
jgi:hypothetical protein